MINQNRGFIIVQQIAPQFELFCDRRQYSMMRLIAGDGEKLPANPIFSHGANIVPLYCENALEIPTHAQPTHAQPIHAQPIQVIDDSLDMTDLANTTTAAASLPSNMSVDITDLSAAQNNVNDYLQQVPSVNPGQMCLEPSRKRRKGNHRCPHCTKTLSRPQTLKDHISNYHPNSSIPEEEKETESLPETIALPGFSSLNGQSSIPNDKRPSFTHTQNTVHSADEIPQGISQTQTISLDSCISCKTMIIFENEKCEKCGKALCEACSLGKKCNCLYYV